jgi:hypothetical protein
VGKVIFYLWNDVFKDFGFDSDIFNDEDESTLSFDKFYSMEDGKVVVQKDKVEKFLKNLGVEVASTSDNNDEYNENADTNNINEDHKETLVAITVNGKRLTADGITQFDLYLNALKEIGIDKVAPVIESMKYRRKGSKMATKIQVDQLLNSDYSYVEVDGYYFVKGAHSYTLIRILEDLKKELKLDIAIEYK